MDNLTTSKEEKKKLLQSAIFPFILIAMLWTIKGIEIAFDVSFSSLGIYPLTQKGLIGIVTSPFIHADISHLFSNSFPLFFGLTALFYFHRNIAPIVVLLITIVTGIWVWVFAREAYHIGASGVVYGLISFLFFSGIVQRKTHLIAFSMLIVFLYGSMIWGIFPFFSIQSTISWESHLMGGLIGCVLALFYKNNEKEEVIDEDDDTYDELTDMYDEK